jgi:hypothetical protein
MDYRCEKCGEPSSLFSIYCEDCLENQREQQETVSAVDHPKHYNQIKGVECIDVAEQMCFNLGNALKYIWRCGDKGKKIEDLEKAIWYIKREIEKTNHAS